MSTQEDIYKRNGGFTKVGMGDNMPYWKGGGGEKSRLGEGADKMV